MRDNNHIILEQFSLVDELNHTFIYLHNSRNIIMTVYKEDVTIDVKESIETIEHMKPFYLGKESMFGIVYPTPGSVITEEAREFWSKNEFIQNNTKALAVLYLQLAHRLIISMFIKFNKPKTPLKVFKNIDSAINWLKECGA